MSETDYRQQVADDAAETVCNFKEEIIEQLLNSGRASDDLLNDYPDGDAWHHENYVDRWYDLTEAADLIDQLSEFEETDSGLWEEQQPKEAIGTIAAYTYGNAVYHWWTAMIREINNGAAAIIDSYDERITEAEDIEETEEDIKTLQEEEAEALRALIVEVAENA